MTATKTSISAVRETSGHVSGGVSAMALSALGVVFGDIGTSPLYTLKTVLGVNGPQALDRSIALGSLSLIFWTLIIITSIKYVSVAMRVDNDGEGGIMALMALLAGRDKKRSAIIAFRLFGAALIYGDGAITPAISVLSALEGLSILTNWFDPYIVPMTVGILVLLFLVQPRGTKRIGKMFGPIMAAWFVAISVLGLWLARTLRLPRSTPPTASGISSRAASPLFSFSAQSFSVSRELKRFTPIWVISAAVPFSSPGLSWFCPALCSITPGRRRLC